MSTMKWTDEAIENWLSEYAKLCKNPNFFPYPTERLLEAAMLELKRVRAWAKHGRDTDTALDASTFKAILRGDPAPTDEQEATK